MPHSPPPPPHPPPADERSSPSFRGSQESRYQNVGTEGPQVGVGGSRPRKCGGNRFCGFEVGAAPASGLQRLGILLPTRQDDSHWGVRIMMVRSTGPEENQRPPIPNLSLVCTHKPHLQHIQSLFLYLHLTPSCVDLVDVFEASRGAKTRKPNLIEKCWSPTRLPLTTSSPSEEDYRRPEALNPNESLSRRVLVRLLGFLGRFQLLSAQVPGRSGLA